MNPLVQWHKHVQDKVELIVKWNDSVNGDVKITQWFASKDIVYTCI